MMGNGKASEIYEKLLSLAQRLPIIDSHEHLSYEKDRLAMRLSFTELFKNYCENDFCSAGVSQADMDEMYAEQTSLERKWEIFYPAYQSIKNGCYARAARISMQKFYGHEDLQSFEDAVDVTEKMRAANTEGLYDRVLRECHVEKCMNCTNEWNVHERFAQVWCVDYLTEPGSLNCLQAYAKDMGGPYPDLAGYADALEPFLRKLKEKGIAAIKFLLAYNRDLSFPLLDYTEAERLYRRIALESLAWRPFVLGYNELRPLQNFLVHKITQAAGKIGLPVVFHTGIQAGNCNNLPNADPQQLRELFLRYPHTRFVLLHAGLPWIDQTILLVKYFPNVYFDLAWVHLISGEIAQTALKHYIDIAPSHKLFGFGGDYKTIELVYGHLCLARENIASALTEKVLSGHVSMADAERWQEAMLYSNLKRFYGV